MPKNRKIKIIFEIG